MIDKILSLAKEFTIDRKKLPKHIALTIGGNVWWARGNKKPLEQAYKKVFLILEEMIQVQLSLNIPIMSVFILSEELRDSERFPMFMELLIKFFNRLKDNKLVHKKKVKISVIGKWYDMPYQLVEPIKVCTDITKEYDSFFLNFCINYSGQDEIVDACRLIARKVKAEKLDPDLVTAETIKDNVYSSYFLPPDIIIVTGKKKCTAGLLLWDSSMTVIFFSEKLFPDFTKRDFFRGMQYYQKAEK